MLRHSVVKRLVNLRQIRHATTLSNDEETLLHEMQKQMVEKSFQDVPQTDISPELREKLNTEFHAFIKEFVHDVSFEDEIFDLFSGTSAVATSVRDLAKASTPQSSNENMTGYSRFPRLDRSTSQEPYTSQELYVRQLFHAKSVAGMGARVTDEYKPHKDVFAPKSISQTSLQTLIAAGAHLGHHTSRIRASTLPYIYGVWRDIHIIDLAQTMTHLKRAAKVTQEIAERGGIVLYVGTREGQERSVQVAAERSNGYYVHTKWMPGTLTNAQVLNSGWERHEVDMADQPTGRQLDQGLAKATIKPDLVVVLNPVENRVLLSECISQRVPTIGVIDTDSEPSLVTYPIPANDDSIRATDLIVGVLSNAAKKGRNYRLQDVRAYQAAEEKAKNAEGFN